MRKAIRWSLAMFVALAFASAQASDKSYDRPLDWASPAQKAQPDKMPESMSTSMDEPQHTGSGSGEPEGTQLQQKELTPKHGSFTDKYK